MPASRANPAKPGLISGCTLRRCPRCDARVFVPDRVRDWRACGPCRRDPSPTVRPAKEDRASLDVEAVRRAWRGSGDE